MVSSQRGSGLWDNGFPRGTSVSRVRPYYLWVRHNSGPTQTGHRSNQFKVNRRLELEAGDPQDGGRTTKAKKASLSHTGGKTPTPRSVARKSLFKLARSDTSLGYLAQRFAEMINCSTDGVLDLNMVAEKLETPKRRIYDVTNVLEGIQLIKKKSKNHIEWMGGKVNLTDVLNPLIEEERRLDELILSCTQQIHQMCENQHTQRFAYLTYEDVQEIPSWKEQTVIVIKAPAETKLEVPHPEESFQVHLSSTQGPIEVFLCSDDPVPMETSASSSVVNGCHLNSSTNGNGSSSPLPSSSFIQVSPKENSYCTSGINNICGPLSEPIQHSSPVTVVPVSPMPDSFQSPFEDQPSFTSLTPPLAFSLDGEEYLLSLAEDQGITDLFSSVDLDHLPLDMPL